MAASRRQEVDLTLHDLARTVHLATDRGVFAADRLDTGTRLLLDHGPPVPARGDLLDLGCGYGPIAVALALRAPEARVWAVDVNERAMGGWSGPSRQLVVVSSPAGRTRLVSSHRFADRGPVGAENAAALGLGRLQACTPDQVPDGLRFAGIWSNPPIRIGAAALHELLLSWLARLDDAGTAALVVQKHLGADSLAAWLGDHGFRVERLRAKQGYRILGVERA